MDEAILSRDGQRIAVTEQAWGDAAAAYASTPEGRERLTGERLVAGMNGQYGREAALASVLRRGETLREANSEARAVVARLRGPLARLRHRARQVNADAEVDRAMWALADLLAR